MFVVSDISKLRVYVNVPQSYVPAIKIGAKAVISMPEYPNRTFDATVEASSQSVDVGSGTTRMQLALDNSSGELMPGGYANVRLSLQRDAVPLHIPASALIFNQNGLRVATVGADDKVLFKTVTIARDLGRDIELASGLCAGRPHHRRTARRHRRRRSGPRRRRQGRQARDGFGKAGREGVGRLVLAAQAPGVTASDPQSSAVDRRGLPDDPVALRRAQLDLSALAMAGRRALRPVMTSTHPPLQHAILRGDDIA